MEQIAFVSYFLDAWERYVFCGEAVVVGYLLHFITFFPMERTLFIHHYLPALFYTIILLPVMLQHVHDEIFRYARGIYLIRNIDFAGNVNEL